MRLDNAEDMEALTECKIAIARLSSSPVFTLMDIVNDLVVNESYLTSIATNLENSLFKLTGKVPEGLAIRKIEEGDSLIDKMKTLLLNAQTIKDLLGNIEESIGLVVDPTRELEF